MKNSEHLQFIHNRMVEVHGENENTDYLIRFREIIKTVEEQETSFNDYLEFMKTRKNSVPKTIMVISKDQSDFITWKHSSGLKPDGPSFINRFKVGNTTYRNVTCVCDTCSMTVDEIILTDNAVENPEYYHILESSRMCLKENHV